jgi:PAS domain S-box-containing protein
MKKVLNYNFWRTVVQSLSGIAGLALLTLVCFRLGANSTTVALLYLIVIVLVSLKSSFAAAAIVSIIAYLLLDSFFTAPLFRLALTEPLDVVAPLAYLSTSFIITRLMKNSRRSFNEIRDLKDQLRLVVDTIPGFAWSALPDGSAEFLNERWLAYTGLPLSEGLDWGGKVEIHTEDREKFMEGWSASLRSGEPLEVEARIRRADGTYRWLLVRAVPLHDRRGEIVKWYGTNTDIDDRKLTEVALQKSQAELAHISRVLTMGELAASIAHEINQPLLAIVTNASACLRWLAGESPNLDEAREAARDIVQDGNRAADVIARIRTFLRKTGADKLQLDINEVIQEVVNLTRNEILRNGVNLKLDLAGDVLPVSGDRVQLQQVILNLVINGIESMTSQTGGPRELVVCSQAYESDKVLVAVKDSGSGISRQDTDGVFDAFYTTKPQGMGMGLAISRSIIENHNGRLWLEPNDGKGTIFQFTLPQYREGGL